MSHIDCCDERGASTVFAIVARDWLRMPNRVWRSVIDGFHLYRWQRERRDAFLTMLALDDRLLDDQGITRADLEWAAALPLHENAALRLRERARDRRETCCR